MVHRFDAILRSPRGGEEPWDRIIDESASFVAVPSLGSLVPGWVLVVPRRPMLNLRELSPNERAELQTFGQRLTDRLAVFGGDRYWFEHGNTLAGGLTGCGVDQAHLHIVPLPFDLMAAAIETPDPDVKWTIDQHSPTFAGSLPPEGEYVAIWRTSDKKAMAGVIERPTSQWVRRIIARNLGRGETWDYQRHPNLNNVLSTISVMQMIESKRLLSQPSS